MRSGQDNGKETETRSPRVRFGVAQGIGIADTAPLARFTVCTALEG
jgi:hypothetical protein